jgi:hypothetical protein
VLSGSCTNLDFGTGDFTGWTGAVGYDSLNNIPLNIFSNGAGIHTLGLNSADSACSFHTLVNAAGGSDYFGGFTKLAPGGSSFSVRLGSSYQNKSGWAYNKCLFQSSASDGEILQQTFSVTAANALITYQYAFVLDSSPHYPIDAAYFRAEVLNQNGKVLPCMSMFLTQDSLTFKGFIKSSRTYGNATSVYYLPWRKASFNLSAYIGTTVTLRFTAAGCVPGGHAGYAYVSASCSPLTLRGSTGNCLNATDTLYAPPGAVSYQWTTVPPGGPGISGPGNKASVAITQNGHYRVTLSYYSGCSYSIDTTLSLSNHPVPSVQIVTNRVPCSTCSNGSVSANVSGGSPAYTYSWSTNPSQSTDTATGIPQGTYTVLVTDANGCAASTTVVLSAPLAVSSKDGMLNWNLYPNPVSDVLMLEMQVHTPQHILISVTDMLGRVLLITSADVQLSSRQSVSLQGLSPGIYFVVLQGATATRCSKIIKE